MAVRLKSLQKAGGLSPSSRKGVLDRELPKELEALVLKEAKKAAAPASCSSHLNGKRIILTVESENSSSVSRIPSRVKFLVVKSGRTYSIDSSFFEQDKRIDAKEILSAFQSITVEIQTSKSVPSRMEEDNVKSLRLSVKRLSKEMLSPYAFGFKVGSSWTADRLNKAFDSVIQSPKYSSAAGILNAVLGLARSRSSREKLVKSEMSAMELGMIQSEFLWAGAVSSALNVNPNLRARFVRDGFALLERNRPVGRFGGYSPKMKFKDAIMKCSIDCGTLPGDRNRVFNVLDADEASSTVRKMEELFEDMTRFKMQNPKCPAAELADRLQEATPIEGRFTWNRFFNAVNESVRESRHSGELSGTALKLKETAEMFGNSRGLFNASKMNWMRIFNEMDWTWLGMLIADTLEDSINSENPAVETISSVVDWIENCVDCRLSIRNSGSAGIRVSLSPCKRIVPSKWKLELQGLLVSGPSWSKIE